MNPAARAAPALVSFAVSAMGLLSGLASGRLSPSSPRRDLADAGDCKCVKEGAREADAEQAAADKAAAAKAESEKAAADTLASEAKAKADASGSAADKQAAAAAATKAESAAAAAKAAEEKAAGWGNHTYTPVSMLCRPSTTGYWKALVPDAAAASPKACEARCDKEARCIAYEYERVDFEAGERECELHDASSYDEAASRATGACREENTLNGWRCCRAKTYVRPPPHEVEVLLMRHAIAPGGGDPAGFAIGDCSTQRTLDAAGRAQAAAVGRRLGEEAAFNVSTIYSSQWCRCTETARLLGAALPRLPGRPATAIVEEWGLNSFYQPAVGGFTKEKCIAQLEGALFKQLSAAAPAEVAAAAAAAAAASGERPGGERALLVTHSVTIQALTGLSVSSGTVVAFNLATRKATVLIDADNM